MVNMLLILVMALFHDASLIIYGLGAYLLGALGTSVGFAIFEAGSIMVANVSGLATGEWAEAGKKSKQWLYGGLLVMIIGIVVVSLGNAMLV